MFGPSKLVKQEQRINNKNWQKTKFMPLARSFFLYNQSWIIDSLELLCYLSWSSMSCIIPIPTIIDSTYFHEELLFRDG